MPADSLVTWSPADDAVRAVHPTEQARYESLAAMTGRSADDLKKRFSEPSFSVGNVGIGTGGSQSRSLCQIEVLPLTRLG